MDRGAVIGQLGVRVAFGLVDGRHDGGGDFGSREVIGEGRGDGIVGLLCGIRIAAEAQGPVVVGQGDAQELRGVQVSDRVGPGQQVPGHVRRPGGGVDQVRGPAEGGDLCKDSVDGGLQEQCRHKSEHPEFTCSFAEKVECQQWVHEIGVGGSQKLDGFFASFRRKDWQKVVQHVRRWRHDDTEVLRDFSENEMPNEIFRI